MIYNSYLFCSTSSMKSNRKKREDREKEKRERDKRELRRQYKEERVYKKQFNMDK